ncbi:high mobility group protein DSP1-like isoform X2 [Pieris brassicae]|uniref:high mobility group protein DSP1-like isoform X2 n=1 Tax=Pieris brassicae TaxID=7116 RepID=UPI001E65EF58|nr:high mobility group protein DSP1-like isoform X2 [Pieris brassicae]
MDLYYLVSQNQSTSDSEQSNQQANGIQQSHQVLQQQQQQAQKDQQSQMQQNQLQQQLEQHQNLQQAIQQAQNLQQSLHQNQQQTLQQMLQQQQQQQLQQLQQQQQQQQQQPQQQIKIEQSNNQQNIIQVTQAQAQALVAQAALQQQVVQTLQQQQQSLQEHLQAVQQQQIQAALQRQSATLQELQQQAQQQALISQNTPKTRMPRSKPPNKPRGRMTAYAFFVQSCREEHKKKYPDENVVFAAFSKKCAERWSTMSEKEKMRFHEMADQDKKRYDLEMKDYVPPKFTKVRGRKRQQPKDPNAPKRSLSAFFWFCNDERSKVKANNPEYTMGDIAKELGRRWAAADSDTKTKYESLSETDKARYDREMTAYKKGSLVLGIQPQQIMIEPDDEEVEFNGDDEYK